MARIRSAKPELRDSRLVASWPFEVRYFWVLLWGYLDDYGRGLDLPKRIAGDCFPHDDIGATEIDLWLDMMTQGLAGAPGPICRYEVDGNRYVHAVNWPEHQKPNRPTPSRLPRCPIHEGLTEPPHGDSLPGAAEQGSRGAEEQQQPVSEPLTPPPHKPASQAARLVVDASGVTPELATEVVAAIWTERKPHNLAGLVRTLIAAGELGEWLQRAQKATDAKAGIPARASQPCPHGTPDGLEALASTGEPRCPQCRKQPRRGA